MITIYGVDETLFKCPGCMAAIRLCTQKGLKYEFKSIIIKSDCKIGFIYDKAAIEECRIRANKKTAPRNYPQIFENDEWIGSITSFKEKYNW